MHVAVSVHAPAEAQLQAPRVARGVITVSEDGRTVYCPEEQMSNILSFEYDQVYRETSNTAQIFERRCANPPKLFWYSVSISVFQV